MARMAVLAFGMQVVCWSENLTQERAGQRAKAMGLPVETQREGAVARKTFNVVSKSTLFQDADVISLHYVLSERSRDLVGEKELALMKSSAMLVNTSRGALIDEVALLSALNRGAIHGAALDVFDIEPLPSNSPWRTTAWGRGGRSQVLLSPHMGFVEEDLMHAFYEEQAENVARFLQGQALHHRLN